MNMNPACKIVLPVLLCSLLAVPAFSKPVVNHTKTSKTHHEAIPVTPKFDEENSKEKAFERFSQTMLKELKADIENARKTLQSGDKNSPAYFDALHILGYEAVLLQNEGLAASYYQQAAMLRLSQSAISMQLDDYFLFKKFIYGLEGKEELDNAEKTIKAYAAYARETNNYYLMQSFFGDMITLGMHRYRTRNIDFSYFYQAIRDSNSEKVTQILNSLSEKPDCIRNQSYVDAYETNMNTPIMDSVAMHRAEEALKKAENSMSEDDKKCELDHKFYNATKDFISTYPEAFSYVIYVKSYNDIQFEHGNMHQQIYNLTSPERKDLYKKNRALFKNEELFKTLHLPE